MARDTIGFKALIIALYNYTYEGKKQEGKWYVNFSFICKPEYGTPWINSREAILYLQWGLR